MSRIGFLYFILFCFTAYSQTEKNIDHQNLLWTRYYNILTLNHKWALHSEFDNRIFLHPVEQNLFLLRMHGRYKINENVDVGAGVSYFSVATQAPEQTFHFDIPEYRIQQDISWKQNFGKITLSHRFQIEERFFHNAHKDGLLAGTTFFWRFRYRLLGEYSFWNKENQYLKAIVYDELMFNGGKNVVKNTFDQNRIYAAFQYGVSKNVALELGYLKSFQQRASGVDYFDRDIIRFTFFHKITL
jgi:Protein of unknown function (DUF2490)